jgi:hypothetical protein
MHIMKKINFLWINFLLIGVCVSNLSAQSLEAGYGHFGAMIYWHGAIPDHEHMEIRRIDPGTKQVQQRWRILPANSVTDFQENASAVPSIFKDVFPFSVKSAEYYIEKKRAATTTASLPLSEIPNVLFAYGLAVWDTTVTRGSTAHYQIYNREQPVGQPAILKAVLNEQYDWAPTYYGVTDNEPIIRCKWKIPYDKKPEVYTYLAYKTAPFTPAYALVNGISSFAVSGDSILAIFMDTASVHSPGMYQYIIRTVNRFGHLGPFSEYAIGSNFPAAAEPIMTYIRATGHTSEPVIELKWRVLNPWRIRTMRLYRSRSYNGPYELLSHFSPTDSTYQDPVRDVMESYFYYFEMDDVVQRDPLKTATVTSESDYAWPAEIPDSVHALVKGKDITVRWKRAGFQDRGYYVLRNEGFGDPDTTMLVSAFIHVQDDRPWHEWTDTSSTLRPGQSYTYAVISESIGYKLSAPSLSTIAQQDVPLYIPAPSDLKLTRLTDSTHLLRWQDLSGHEANHHLGYRVFSYHPTAKEKYKTVHDTMLLFEHNYLELKNLSPKDTFVVKAYNIYGNESVYSTKAALDDPRYYRFGPEYLRGVNEETGIRLKWNKPLRRDIVGYTIYKVGPDEKMISAGKPAAKDGTYLDTKIKKGETYYYFITARSRSGLESEASEPLVITR